MSLTREEADAQLNALAEEQRWDEVLQLCRRMAEELHVPTDIGQVLQHVRVDTEQLRAEDTGSSLWLLGTMQWGGLGDMARSNEEALRYFSRAAEKGHLLSRYRVGFMTAHGQGVVKDEARGFALMV